MSKATIHVQVKQAVRDEVEKVAESQRWTLGTTVEVLLEEALEARKREAAQ